MGNEKTSENSAEVSQRTAELPAGEHHTGTLGLKGEGNAPASPISDDAVGAFSEAP